MRAPLRRFELIAGQFQELPQRITEVERIHEAAIDGTGIVDVTLAQPFNGLDERCL